MTGDFECRGPASVARGHHVSWLGADVPAESLVDAANTQRSEIVLCIGHRGWQRRRTLCS